MRFKMRTLFPAMLLLTGLQGTPLCAEEATPAEFSCTSANIVAVPSRPTVSNSTDTTHCGVVEVEYGLERQWPGEGANRDDLFGGLRMGLTQKLDFHYASTTFLHLMDSAGDRTGFGDTVLSLKYRFLEQSAHRPALGLYYSTKVPTASVVEGLGSGAFDHSLSLLVSKDVHPLRFDFNFTPVFAGRPGRPGFDHNYAYAMACVAPLWARLNMTLEGYGASALDPEFPAFGVTTLAFSYAVRPRMILDTGLDVGVTPGAPRKRVFVGITYAVGNMYALFRKPH